MKGLGDLLADTKYDKEGGPEVNEQILEEDDVLSVQSDIDGLSPAGEGEEEEELVDAEEMAARLAARLTDAPTGRSKPAGDSGVTNGGVSVPDNSDDVTSHSGDKNVGSADEGITVPLATGTALLLPNQEASVA